MKTSNTCIGLSIGLTCAVSAFAHPVVKTPANSRLFESVIDSVSGVTTYLLKEEAAPQWNAQTLYFTTPTYSADGRFLIFLSSDDEFKSETAPRKIMLIDFLKDAVIDLHCQYDRGPFLDSKTDSLYYFNRPRRMLCRRDLLTDPLKEVDVTPLPAEFGPLTGKDYFFTHITLSQDRRRMWCDCNVSNRCFQGMLDLTNGRFEKWSETPFLCNHGQLNPVRDDIALCAWEYAKFKCPFELTEDEKKTAKIDKSGLYTDVKRPTGWVYPRLQLFEKAGSAPTTIPSAICNYATHEWWARDGRGFIFCGGGNVIYHDLASGKQRIVCSHGGTHATMTADNRYIVFDRSFRGSPRGKPFGVGLCDAEKDRVIWIRPYTGRYCEDNLQSKLHPDTHPHFSADDRWVVWTWLKFHRMRVAVTEVAPLLGKLSLQPETETKKPRDWSVVIQEIEAFLQHHQNERPLSEDEKATALSLACESPTWCLQTIALFEKLYASENRQLTNHSVQKTE